MPEQTMLVEAASNNAMYIVLFGIAGLAGLLGTLYPAFKIIKNIIVGEIETKINSLEEKLLEKEKILNEKIKDSEEDLENKISSYKTEQETVRTNTNKWIERIEDTVKKHNDLIIEVKTKVGN